MRKFKWQTILVCVLVMILVLVSAVDVSASSVGKNITVFFNDIKLMVDGESVTPKDANGNVVEPFVYNGTTYLPVRAIATALGKDVNWDAETATVVIGEYDAGESLYPDVKLEDLDYLYKSGELCNGSASIKDNFGNAYNGRIEIYQGKVAYALNGQYSKLKGTVILKYDYKNAENPEGEYKFIVDEKTVKTISLLKAGDSPVDFIIDLTNANRLEIICESSDGRCNAIVDAGFYK